jgi:two-component system, NarL family, sensor histidine kinase UhpB
MAASLRKPLRGSKDAEAVEAIIAVCDRLFAVIRGMMRRLRPMLLDELGLVASLEDMTGAWRERNPAIQLDFRCDGAVEECAGSTRIHLFRITQECLTNVIKHADARHVRIHLNLVEIGQRRWIELEIGDDGRGFDPDQPRSGFGLLGMRERVASLGGRFMLRTRPSQGVTINVQVPCTRENPNP